MINTWYNANTQRVCALLGVLTINESDFGMADIQHNQIIPRKQAAHLGLKHYFTGKACKNGHLSKRMVLSSMCLECAILWRNIHKIKKKKYPVNTKWRKKYISSEKYKRKKRLWASSPQQKIKHAARNLLRIAIKNGVLSRLPCKKCGNIKSEGHHEDYSRPLEVIWLCRKHHAEHHKLKKD